MAIAPNKTVLLEVAVASVDDALAAAAGGADRLELNAALALGGLTPSLGTLIEVKAAVRLPLMVMIRPRPGGFAYSAADFKVMQRDTDLALEHGVDGIVCGMLNADGSVDMPHCRALVRQAGGCQVVFHRAFDVTPDPNDALERLIELGFRRVMTSGQEETAVAGAGLIAELMRRAARRVEVLPAGGINRATAAELVARTGCDQVHASLRMSRMDSSVAARPHVTFNSRTGPTEGNYQGTDAEAVAELRKLLGDRTDRSGTARR
jgi:copper homeostasis protein